MAEETFFIGVCGYCGEQEDGRGHIHRGQLEKHGHEEKVFVSARTVQVVRRTSFLKVEAERDQLDQQVEALLSAVDQALEILGSGECSVNNCEGCQVETAEARRELSEAADQVRKERGNGN